MTAIPAEQHPAAAPELANKRRFFLIALGVLLAVQLIGLILFITMIDFRTPLDASGEAILDESRVPKSQASASETPAKQHTTETPR